MMEKDIFSPIGPDNWRMRVTKIGNVSWRYLVSPGELKEETPQSFIEKYNLNTLRLNEDYVLEEVLNPRVSHSIEAALRLFKTLQHEVGIFPGCYDGVLYIPSMYLIALYISRIDAPSKYIPACVQYLLSVVNEDGGWGLAEKQDSTVLCTTLAYVACRLHGVPRDNAILKKALQFIHSSGGATHIPQWGRLLLCVLNLYDYSGMNPILPELWLIPSYFPLSMFSLWIHSRIISLPMSYLYGKKCTVEITPLLHDIREYWDCGNSEQEIYLQKYEDINWTQYRDCIAHTDEIVPYSGALKWLNFACRMFELLPIPFIRSYSLNNVVKIMEHEDGHTSYANIAPVNKAFNMICAFFLHGRGSRVLMRHARAYEFYPWVNSNALMSFNGTDGTQDWLCAYTYKLQGMMRNPQFVDCVKKNISYINSQQCHVDLPDRNVVGRNCPVGSWPFSTKLAGTPIIDVTALCLKVLSIAKTIPELENYIYDLNLKMAADFVLNNQSPDGSFSSYEPMRGYRWLEKFNSASVFKDIMVDVPHRECTATAIMGLCEFRRLYPSYKKELVSKCISSAVDYLFISQNSNGSWSAFWGVYYTYSMFFVLSALRSLGHTYDNCLPVKKACDFLIQNMHQTGGWSEDISTPLHQKYMPLKSPDVSQTSWAVSALIDAKYPNRDPIDKSVEFIIDTQTDMGDWLEGEVILGLFNFTNTIRYAHYRHYFPVIALSKYMDAYGDIPIKKSSVKMLH